MGFFENNLLKLHIQSHSATCNVLQGKEIRLIMQEPEPSMDVSDVIPMDQSVRQQERALQHVAIIMDGNGRWAEMRGLERSQGHRAGIEAVRHTVRYALQANIPYLTLFSFSSENWRRPAHEISNLITLLRGFVDADLDTLVENGVRIRIIGERVGLAPDIIDVLERAEMASADNTRLMLIVAFNYGGRNELLRITRRLGARIAAGELAADTLDEASIAAELDTAGIPDPDLIVRTSGEQRLSNFLLWQAAYSEFVFLSCYWPDFDEAQFAAAIAEYHRRERRFGTRHTVPA